MGGSALGGTQKLSCESGNGGAVIALRSDIT
jgi:hypothetical protein